jgi:hypothetical protein
MLIYDHHTSALFQEAQEPTFDFLQFNPFHFRRTEHFGLGLSHSNQTLLGSS